MSSIRPSSKALVTLLALCLLDLRCLQAQQPEVDLRTPSGFEAALSGIHKLEDRRKLDEALLTSARFEAAVEQLYGGASPLTAVAKREFAEAYMLHSDFGHPVTLLQEALRIFDSYAAPGQFQAARTKVDLGVCNAMIGQLAEAERLDLEALNYFNRTGHVDEASTVRANLARLFARQGKIEDAISLNRQELAARREKYRRDDPGVLTILYELGVDYLTLKDMPKAESLLREVLAAEDKRSGHRESNPLVLRTLGYVLVEEGKFSEAEVLLRRAMDRDVRRVGSPSHEAFYLSMLYAHTGRWEEATRLIDGRVRYPALRAGLSCLSESEQLSYLQDYMIEVQTALSFGLAQPNDPKIVTASAQWLLASKGLAHEALAERTLLARDSADPQVVQIAGELQSVRTRLALLANTVVTAPDAPASKDQLEQLLQREAELSRQLGQAEHRPPSAGRGVELADVRAGIPAGGILLEFARINAEDLSDHGGPNGAKGISRYGVWIIPPGDQTAIQLVDLGDANTIDAEIEKVRRIFNSFDLSIDQDEERDLEQEFKDAAAPLTNLILKPLEDRVGDVKRWILSPDGQLWLVPWAALCTTDGRSLVESHTVSYVISGRDLLVHGRPVQDTTPPVIMADPNYNLPPDEAASKTRKLIGELKTDTGLADLSPPEVADARTRVRRLIPSQAARPLPHTREEAMAILPFLEAYAKAKPRLFMGDDALEGVFKSIRRPRDVVFSTHGQFITTKELGFDDSHLKPGTGFLLENPLLRCRLLLAGCNQRTAGSDDADDGILTGMKIVGCDLRGTDLVVLSACQTALGDVYAGMSAAGLRQAFQLAGAQTVVASLWSVPDVETAALMKGFFKNLAAGDAKADALADAQRDLIKTRRAARKGAAHPYFWAAFTLTGAP
ncbi:MAG: CHAT domain-containing protein [Verrucomicrobia bacterium]|nr:CHAT domain-containing protein [Verrucomicrobiota bacterium]